MFSPHKRTKARVIRYCLKSFIISVSIIVSFLFYEKTVLANTPTIFIDLGPGTGTCDSGTGYSTLSTGEQYYQIIQATYNTIDKICWWNSYTSWTGSAYWSIRPEPYAAQIANGSFASAVSGWSCSTFSPVTVTPGNKYRIYVWKSSVGNYKRWRYHSTSCYPESSYLGTNDYYIQVYYDLDSIPQEETTITELPFNILLSSIIGLGVVFSIFMIL